MASPVNTIMKVENDNEGTLSKAACKTCKTVLQSINQFFETNIPEQIINFSLGAICTVTLFQWGQCFKLVLAYSPLIADGLRAKILEPNYF